MFEKRFDLEGFKEKVMDAFVACYDERPVICGKMPGTFRVEKLQISLGLLESQLHKDFKNVNIELNQKMDSKNILRLKDPRVADFMLGFMQLIREQHRNHRSEDIKRGIKYARERKANNEQNIRSSNHSNKSSKRFNRYC